jgi:hypothetical protein
MTDLLYKPVHITGHTSPNTVSLRTSIVIS